jgi:hypothetical protein
MLFGKDRDSMPFATFSAYFDASGNKNEHRILTVAGFVSRVKKWDRFGKRWSSILDSYGVRSMHMTDFASSGGEFKDWKGKSELRRAFMEELVKCIKDHTNKGFASSVVIPGYNEVNREYMLSEKIGQPYAVCGMASLGALALWARKKRIDIAQMIIAVEQGDQDQGELIELARKDGMKVIAIPKQDTQAFQAGDIVAWKSRTAIHQALYGPATCPQDLDSIMRSLKPINPIVHRNGGFDKDRLLRYCQRKGIKRREQ